MCDFDGAGNRRQPCCRHLQLSGRRGPRRATVRPTEGRLRLRQSGTGRFTRRAAKWPIQERGTRSQAITVGSRSGLWRLTAVLMPQAIADLLRRRAAPAALLQTSATQ